MKDDLGEPVDDHPSVHHLFEAHIPDSHPDIDELLAEGYTLPSWHPDISKIVTPRPLMLSPASILCFAVAGLAIAMMLVKSVTKWKNSKQTREITITKDYQGDTSSSSDSLSEAQDGNIEVMRRDPCVDPINPNEERILVYKEKKSTWKTFFGRRVIKSSHSTGKAVLCVMHILINLAALWASPNYPFEVGFGSLAVGNQLLSIVTASRNSVFTWFLGIAFDQVLVYHRFVGRLTILFAVIHSGYYVSDVFEKTSDPVTLTGLVSLGCGLVILLSSLNFVRRKFFNVFFWSHFSFIGFLIGTFLHAHAARPYIIGAVLSYCLDKGVQMTWKLPTKTTIFEKVDERTVHVQYAKSSLATLVRRHVSQVLRHIILSHYLNTR